MLFTLNKNYWKNKKVFVTGHTGFKGSWLCIFLTYLGAEVTGYSLEPKTKPNLFHLANIKFVALPFIISFSFYSLFFYKLKFKIRKLIL